MFPLSSLKDEPHLLSLRNFRFLFSISGDICSSSTNDLSVVDVDNVDIVDPVVVVDVIDALVEVEDVDELDATIQFNSFRFQNNYIIRNIL